MSSARKQVVVIGGGNGSGAVISSLKDDFEVSAAVSMADDGGSTGRLRKEYDVSAVGDIRQCLVALADSENSKNLFSYRFGEGNLKGHSFGNIFLTTIERSTRDLYKAINQAKSVLNIKYGDVIPVTDDKPALVMNYENKKITGVYSIAGTKISGKVTELSLNPADSKLSKKAAEYIKKADLIVISPGNFYCSIMPALLTGGLTDALAGSKAKKVFISNLANFPNHTKGYTTSDYLSEINRLTKAEFIDILVANNNYDVHGEEAVRLGKPTNKNIQVIKENLVSSDKSNSDPNDKIALIRSKVSHDKTKLNKIFTQILRS